MRLGKPRDRVKITAFAEKRKLVFATREALAAAVRPLAAGDGESETLLMAALHYVDPVG
jgi:hypothetical protein